MPWYLPWSEGIKKRACRYLLQRYLGQFLEEKLTLDQLTVDLYNGIGSVSSVKLDVQALNELGEQQNLPVEFVDGYISEISVSIPWASLLTDSSYVEVKGLVLTIQPKQRADTGASMFESVWSSMSSSMQLAEECLRDGELETDQGRPLEGLELFAQAIDSILCRVKVKFVDTRVRLEHVPKGSAIGVALELRIRSIDYFDECGNEIITPPEEEIKESENPSLDGNRLYRVAAFACKAFHFEGIQLLADEFPTHARTFSRSVMSISTTSSPGERVSDGILDSPMSTEGVLEPGDPMASSRLSDSSCGSGERSTAGGNLLLEPDPVVLGRLTGRQEVRLRLRQQENVPGPKVQIEAQCGALLLFLSPRQAHLLLELLEGLAQPHNQDTSNVPVRSSRLQEKPMGASDFRRVEQELQQQLRPAAQSVGVRSSQGWSTAALGESEEEEEDEEEFLPMGGAMGESAMSLTSSVSSSCSSHSCYSEGKGSSQRFSTPCASFAPGMTGSNKKKSSKNQSSGNGRSSGNSGGFSGTEVSRFRLRLAAVGAVLLHEDLLTSCAPVSTPGTAGEVGNSGGLARSSVEQMKMTAEAFFQSLGPFGNAPFGSRELPLVRQAFEAGVSLSHLRLLITAVAVEGSERAAGGSNGGDVLSSQLSVHHLEVVERLVDSAPAQTETVELLAFEQESVGVGGGEACVRLHYERWSPPSICSRPQQLRRGVRAEARVALGRCRCELDVSIVDRVHMLLQPQPLCTAGQQAQTQGIVHRQQESSVVSTRTRLSAHCPFVTLKVRFPTPDLRPLHDMDRAPWWKRHVRKDFLTFELTDANFATTFDTNELTYKYEISCREVHGLFQEAETDAPASFARATAVDRNGNPLTSPTVTSYGDRWAQGAGERPQLIITLSPEIPDPTATNNTNDPSEADSDGASSGDCGEGEVGGAAGRAAQGPSPFSAKRVVHESDTPHSRAQSQDATVDGEEFIIPGDRQEMKTFVTWVQSRCRLRIDVLLPSVSVLLPSKHLYELLYNRLNTDMLLWEPSAPRPPPSNSVFQGSDALASLFQEAFCMCKSAVHYDSDSDSSEGEGVFYSTYEQRQQQRRQQRTRQSRSGLSFSQTSLALSVGQGALSVCAPVRDSGGHVIPGQQGELLIQLQEGNLFSVSGYGGQLGLGYICLQVQEAAFYHNGLVSNPEQAPSLPVVGGPPPLHLLPTVVRSGAGVRAAAAGTENKLTASKEGMLSVAIRVRTEDSVHAIKTFRVAAALRGATLCHRTVPGAHSWFTQFVDFFDVNDYPIAGYDPPGVITELQLHLWGCAVDYRPLYLPLRSVLTVGSFSVTSNIAAHTSTSTLRFIAEEAALFLSDKVPPGGQIPGPGVADRPLDLKRDYVCVMDLGLFELSLRLCSQQTVGLGGSVPRVDLRASNNVLHLRTCADSAKALTDLLTYFASDGDLRPANEEGAGLQDSSGTGSCITTSEPLPHGAGVEEQLSQSQVARVNALIEEAMRESLSLHQAGPPKASPNRGRGVEVFFFPDEAKGPKTLADSEFFPREEADGESSEDNWEHDFCILDKEAGSGFLPRNSLPEVRLLSNDPVRLVENHFSVPLGRTDLLKAPKGFPPAVLRYTLCEMTVIWHMYGGSDFGPAPAKASDTTAKSALKSTIVDDDLKAQSQKLPVSPPAMNSRPSPCFPSDSVRRPPPGTNQVSFSKASPSEVHFAYTPPRGTRASSPQEKHFCPPQPQQPPLSWQAKGGPGRQHDVLMELQLNKVRFQHEVYPETSLEASRQVLLVGDLELRDRLASSDINKFLHHYTSEARPRQSHANMIVVKAVHVRPDSKLQTQECSLRVSLLPLRLHIDQDALLFLCQFFSDISGRKAEAEGKDGDGLASEQNGPAAGAGSGGNGSAASGSPAHLPPVMTVHQAPDDTQSSNPENYAPEPQQLLIMLEDELSQVAKAPNPSTVQHPPLGASGGTASQPVFFRSFVFAPDVPIRLDYQGKRVDLSHGPLAGLLMGLGQLNCSELRLKRLSHRHGLLGFDKLLAYALSEWLSDVKRHQLPWIIGGVGPLPALLQLWSGIRDLFLLPLEQYQRDGRLARGLRRGAGAFAGSTAVAALELTQRLVAALQATAELAYDMVSPGPARRTLRPVPPSRGHRRRRCQGRPGHSSSAALIAREPGDLREGVARALAVVRDGLGETAHALVAAAREQHESKGCVGAVGGVLRQLPPTAIAPLLLATEATGAVLGGMRAQLQPADARRDARDKWRTQPDA